MATYKVLSKPLHSTGRPWLVPAVTGTRTVRDMLSWYRSFDAVVQPSRGEGFGMVPLEARCCGVPVIMTPCTGHSEHVALGVDTLVGYGEMSKLATQGNDVGSCPSVTVNNVTKALLEFAEHREALRTKTETWAKSTGAFWTWDIQLKPLIKLIRDGLVGIEKEIVLGADVSLRGLE